MLLLYTHIWLSLSVILLKSEILNTAVWVFNEMNNLGGIGKRESKNRRERESEKNVCIHLPSDRWREI